MTFTIIFADDMNGYYVTLPMFERVIPLQMVTFSRFRMATFRQATRKYATFHTLRFRLLFVVSLPRGATFPVFAPKTRLYDMTQISHHIVPKQHLTFNLQCSILF